MSTLTQVRFSKIGVIVAALVASAAFFIFISHVHADTPDTSSDSAAIVTSSDATDTDTTQSAAETDATAGSSDASSGTADSQSQSPVSSDQGSEKNSQDVVTGAKKAFISAR